MGSYMCSSMLSTVLKFSPHLNKIGRLLCVILTRPIVLWREALIMNSWSVSYTRFSLLLGKRGFYKIFWLQLRWWQLIWILEQRNFSSRFHDWVILLFHFICIFPWTSCGNLSVEPGTLPISQVVAEWSF